MSRRKRGITVDQFICRHRAAVVAVAALAVVLAVNAPAQALAMDGHAFSSSHPSAGMSHGFDGHRGVASHGFDHHHDFDRHHFGHGFVYPYYYGYYPYYEYDPAPYTYQAPAYWFYCPSYGAYYPNVVNCPDPWVTVPAS
jgi:hypothetical protein